MIPTTYINVRLFSSSLGRQNYTSPCHWGRVGRRQTHRLGRWCPPRLRPSSSWCWVPETAGSPPSPYPRQRPLRLSHRTWQTPSEPVVNQFTTSLATHCNYTFENGLLLAFWRWCRDILRCCSQSFDCRLSPLPLPVHGSIGRICVRTHGHTGLLQQQKVYI